MRSIETKNEKLHSYVDDQMTEVERLAFEQEIENNPSLRDEVNRLRTHNRDLRASIPNADNDRMKAILYRAERNVSSELSGWMRAAAVVTLVAVGAASGYGISDYQKRNRIAALEELVRDTGDVAVAAHSLYSVEVVHPVEVVAEEREHLTKWLSKRLGHPVSAPDMNEFGFFLVGGRLLPSGDNPAAQFMYENERGQRITFFATIADRVDPTSMRYRSKNGITAAQWRDGVWDYTIVGELDRTQMEEIAKMLHGQLT